MSISNLVDEEVARIIEVLHVPTHGCTFVGKFHSRIALSVLLLRRSHVVRGVSRSICCNATLSHIAMNDNKDAPSRK